MAWVALTRVAPWSMTTFPSATASRVLKLYVILSARSLMSWYSMVTPPCRIEYSSFCSSVVPPSSTVILTSPPPGFGPGMKRKFGFWAAAEVARIRASAMVRARGVIRGRILPRDLLLLVGAQAHGAVDARHLLQLHPQ